MPSAPTIADIEKLFDSELQSREKVTYDSLTFGAMFGFRASFGLEFLQTYQNLPKDKTRFWVTKNPYHVNTFDIRRKSGRSPQ